MNSYSAYTDSELIDHLRKGDEQAFTALFSRHWLGLYEKAETILHNPAVAKDIVQEVFYSLWRRRDTLDIQSVRAYLEQATRFQVFKAIRDQKAGRELADKLATITEEIRQDDPSLFREHQQLLEYLTNKLPAECREAFRLSRRDQLSYKEIAHHLQISERAVEHRIAKALEFLRTHYTYEIALVLLAAEMALA